MSILSGGGIGGTIAISGIHQEIGVVAAAASCESVE